MGEVLQRKENYVAIDKSVTDALGIPALHIQARYSDNDVNMIKHAVTTFEELCHGAGFELLAKHDHDDDHPFAFMRASEYIAEQMRAGNL